MNLEIKKKWVSALKSGNYLQGRGALRQRLEGNNKYCCLGVLCELFANERHDAAWGNINLKTRELTFTCSDESGPDFSEKYLPIPVKTWAEIPNCNPQVGDVSLAEHNDTGRTFTEIADLIERYL